MKNTLTRTLSLLITILLSAIPSLVAGIIPIVHGRLQDPNHDVVQGLYVSIEDDLTHARTAQMAVRLDGSFEFRDVANGEYTLHVTDGQGLTVHQQNVTIREPMSEVEVRLPKQDAIGGLTKAGTVSLTELTHPPDKKAVRAFQTALRFAEGGKYEEASTELEKAIRISPEFSAAHTNLAVQYFRLGRFEESAAESMRAIQIGGPKPLFLCNLATAQARLERYEEAEKSARAALRLDSRYIQANLILGFILVDDPARRSEGLKHLEKAAPAFDSARLFLERVRASQ